eukprot:1366419-Prymnesium_polylepis.1
MQGLLERAREGTGGLGDEEVHLGALVTETAMVGDAQSNTSTWARRTRYGRSSAGGVGRGWGVGRVAGSRGW